MSAVASQTGQEAFIYWVKTVFPEIYEEDLEFSELLTRVINFLETLYGTLHVATYKFTEMGTTFENILNYVSAFAETPDPEEPEEDFNPQTIEAFRKDFITKNIETVSKLNEMFFGLFA